ncbi:putative clathrin assembly protein At1g03050 [Ananas comosus]|uniref:Clathrin assembly protein At1g03050 n=1 Tax=Ananas comosus TaxID=4615 RepID=A0A6P5F3T5_ANACO|nr:putative clathrin assembly protein At1g03050 [Ananas comosus]
MAPSTIRKALGAVKDRTSIGLAKVSSNGSVASELDVAIVKATRHDEFPAEERHVREILSLTCYSRAYVARCVAALSRRLGRTRSWSVALKTLVLVHRLLADGDPAFEQELFFATRRGTRLLNLSDFRDSDAWDFSAFVRTFALYLDQRLDYRMHARRARRTSTALCRGGEEDEAAEENAEEENLEATTTAASRGTPVREMKTDRILVRTQHLQQLLERFLACRPTGAAKANRIVAVALYPLVKESFQIYYDLAEAMSALIDRFTDLDVPDCARVHNVFARLAKQLDELGAFYAWCKSAAICRPSEFPDVERITPRKLDLMDEFIRDKSAAAAAQSPTLNLKPLSLEDEEEHENRLPEDDAYADMANIRALPAPEEENRGDDNDINLASTSKAEAKASSTVGEERGKENEREADLLNLEEDVMTGEEHGEKLALALFDGSTTEVAPRWEAFDEHSADWETALVQSASGLSGQKASLGGGLDMTLLDGMYGHAQASAAVAASVGYAGSASSVAIRVPPAQATMLALPAPPTAGGGIGGDPFAASAMVAPPTYVQMSDMQKKQGLLAEEQQMWQQYARDGMQGQMSFARLQQQQQPPMAAALSRPPQNGAYYYHQNNMGGYNRMY